MRLSVTTPAALRHQGACTPRPSIEPMRDLLADLDDAQRRAVTIEAAPLAIVAGAGSGKTRVLTRRIAYRVANGSADASHTVVLTFTRRASAELNQRLLALGLRERVVCGTLHSVA